MRVLEPSPPAVGEPPWFADDPVAGGDVVPLDRPCTTSWADLCTERSDSALRAWCEDRWLVRRPLGPLPPAFGQTRRSLHALAEHVLAPARHAATGKIGLRYTYRGFGTPYFGPDRQLRVEDGELVDGERRARVTTLGQAAAFAGVAVPAATGVYTPTTAPLPDEALPVDPAAARALGDWFGFCASVLEQLRDEAAAADGAARVQLWPEHFDMAVDLGPDGARANFGGSPGDDDHAEPYLYVGPWEQRSGGFWNEPFGASLPYAELVDGADALAFLRKGRVLLR
ncbi:MAG: hypothetical protein ACRD03_09290 [Acidimicrobiales bacterium]